MMHEASWGVWGGGTAETVVEISIVATVGFAYLPGFSLDGFVGAERDLNPDEIAPASKSGYRSSRGGAYGKRLGYSASRIRKPH
jgi:hypothetical protein